MATSNEKIAAGLNSREHGPTLDRFIALQPVGEDGKSRLPSPSLIKETAFSARSKLSELQDIVRDVSKAAENGRAEGERQAQKLKNRIGRDERREVAREYEAEARKTRADYYAGKRTEIIEALKGYSAKVDVMKSLWGSPTSLLTSKVLGSEKASRYQAQLAGAGEAQLAVAIRTAIATSNADMAYAALAACDARGFRVSDLVQGSRDEVAAAALGSSWSEVGDALKVLEHATGDALVLERELTTGKRDPLATLSRGLRDKPDHNRDGAGDPGDLGEGDGDQESVNDDR